MALIQHPGQDVALQGIANGQVDFVWADDNDLLWDDTQEYRVTTLLVSRLGEYWADGTGRRGSRLHTVKSDTKVTGAQLEQYAMEALQKAVDEHFIKNVRATATRGLNRAYRLVVRYDTATKTNLVQRYDLTV